MKRLLVLLMVGLPFMISSCSSDEEDNILNSPKGQTENPQNEYVSMGYMDISPLNATRSETANIYSVNFNNENRESMLHFDLIKSKESDFYGCDMNGDGTSDFYVQFLNRDMSEFYYLDHQKKKLKKCSLTRNSKDEFSINVLELYGIPDSILTRSESWSDCFSRRIGSSLGITMEIAAGFIGPEGSAAVAIGGALSCAIWDPF